MDQQELKSNPAIVQETIDRVINKMRYRKWVRADVRAELEGHFEDALAECQNDQERLETAQRLVEEFGDTKLLGQLIRRAKKRCRPLWAKVMIRTFQVAGLCVLYFVLCISRLYIGYPTIKMETVELVNNASQKSPDESLNAWPDIENALSELTPLPDLLKTRTPYHDMNEMQQQIVQMYVLDHEEAFARLAQAVQKPYCWRQFDPVSDEYQFNGTGVVLVPQLMESQRQISGMLDQVMPQMSRCRQGAFALDYRRQWYVAQGRADLAMADVVTLFRLGSLQNGNGMLLEQMVGNAIVAVALDSLFDTINQLEVNEEVLAQTQDTLCSLWNWDHNWIDLTLEKVFYEDLIQRGFTDDGHGNGRMLSSGMYLVLGTHFNWWKGLLFYDLPDRREVQASFDNYFNDIDRWHQQTPWERQDQVLELTDPSLNGVVLKPGLEQGGDLQWRTMISAQACLAVLAIKRYQIQQGYLPEDLQDLVEEGLFEKPPRDFYGPGALTYQRQSDQDFILYSWGENLKDDHGTPSNNGNGELQQYGSQGDWIFWPPQ